MRLKHCPFCGEEESVVLESVGLTQSVSYRYCIRCRTCDARGPEAESLTSSVARDAAVSRWNDRLSHAEDLSLRTAFELSNPG